MSANMLCELKSCLEVIIVILTLWAKDNKGCGSEEPCLHLREWQKTGIICFSAGFMFLLHCRNFYSLPCTSIFRFVSVHLSSAKPITWGHFESVRVRHNICQPHPLSPLLSVNTASPQQLFQRPFTFFFYHLPFFSFIFQWDFHSRRNDKNALMFLFVLLC